MPAFEFQNDVYDKSGYRINQRPHLHTDDDLVDPYYAYDDDHLRGTHGTGMTGEGPVVVVLLRSRQGTFA